MSRHQRYSGHAYAIVRIDYSQLNLGDIASAAEAAFTVKEILLDEDAALREVERLNRMNGDKACRYSMQVTRILGEAR